MKEYEVVSGLHDRISALEGIIKLLTKDLTEKIYTQSEMETTARTLADSILLSSKPPAKWYDNIPEYGVLCWCEGEHDGLGFADDIPCKRILARIDSYEPQPTRGFFTANWGFLNRENWVWYKIVQPLTNEEIEEFKR